LVEVGVRPPIGNSDHSHLSVRLSLKQSAPEVNLRQDVFLKSSVDWPAVVNAFSLAPWREIRCSADPGRSLDAFVKQLVLRHVPVREIRIRSRDRPWFDASCRRAYELKQRCYSEWRRLRTGAAFEDFRVAQRRAKVVYGEAERAFVRRARETLGSVDSAHRWWSTLKGAVFGASPSIPPLFGAGGGLVCDPVDKANLLLNSFQSKQSSARVTPLLFVILLLC